MKINNEQRKTMHLYTNNSICQLTVALNTLRNQFGQIDTKYGLIMGKEVAKQCENANKAMRMKLTSIQFDNRQLQNKWGRQDDKKLKKQNRKIKNSLT